MSSDRNMERERFRRDTARAGFVETDLGVWVRAVSIEAIHQTEAGFEGCSFTLGGVRLTSRLTSEQLMRAIVAAQGRDIS